MPTTLWSWSRSLGEEVQLFQHGVFEVGKPSAEQNNASFDFTWVSLRRNETKAVGAKQEYGSTRMREAKVIAASTAGGRHLKTSGLCHASQPSSQQYQIERLLMVKSVEMFRKREEPSVIWSNLDAQ